MSIKQLVDYIGETNIAEDIDEQTLIELGKQVKRQYDEDKESMEQWCQHVEKGIELMRQEWEPKSTPWQGASNYKDPILTEASVKFGDRASLELLRNKDLVAAEVIGRDPQGQKKALAERISEVMSYQVNHDMDGWRDGQERLFYSLPNYGHVFKKVTYDNLTRQCDSTVICYPDFAVNQATKSLDTARSFSHVLDFSENEIEERVRSETWVEFRPEMSSESEIHGDSGSNEANSTTDAEDNPDNFIEQQCFFDLDEDGYEEPYIVTIHQKTCKVVRIVARFDENSIIVKHNDMAMPLPEAREMAQAEEVQGFGGARALQLLGLQPRDVDPDDFELLKIEPFQNVVGYSFIPAPDGTYLSLGYAHLLGAMNQAINTTTNQLTDAGTLENLSGGFLSKEFRKELGLQRMRPGQWLKTDVPSEKFDKGIKPKPSQPPSHTLYQLGQDKLERAMGYLAIIDISGQIQANTAPTTALTIIEEAAIPTTALFSRILRATSKEFEIIYRHNQRTFPADKYQMIVGDPEADPMQDFNAGVLTVSPTANAEMSARAKRLQAAMAQMEMFDRVLQAGGNPIPILREVFDAIGSEITDAVFPEEGSMSPEEKQQLEQLRQAQDLQNQIAQQQLQILAREQDRLDADTKADISKTMAEIEEIAASIEKMKAESIKYLEQAESEQVKNQLDAYTSQFKAINDRLKVFGDYANRSREIQSRIQSTPSVPQQPVRQPMAPQGNITQ